MSPKSKILIVDSEEFFLRTTSAVLEREGYQCTCVTNVTAAEELIEQKAYDLVIADAHLPGNTQLELVQRLRETNSSLPVILVTGSPNLDSALRAISLQVSAYLVKPFETRRLLTIVQDLVARTKRQKTVFDLQRRWQSWGKELHDFAAATPLDAIMTEQRLEAMLRFSLCNLSRCIADLQDFCMALTANFDQNATPRLAEKSDMSLEVASQVVLPPSQNDLTETKLNSKGLPDELLASLQQLSRREREVLRLLLSNHRPQKIAQTLFISLYTVRNHLRSIFEKFSVHSQAELLTLLGQYATYDDLQEAV